MKKIIKTRPFLQASAVLGWDGETPCAWASACAKKMETKILAAICNKSRRRQPSKQSSLAT